MLRRALPLLAATALTVGAIGFALPADACGGLFCQATPIDQAGERILFASDGTDVTAYVQIQYTGAAEQFSWIVPVPTTPKLSVGSDALFTALRGVTRPTFNLSITDEGNCKQDNRAKATSERNNSGVVMNSAMPGVNIVSQDQVGAFDAVVLEATDAEALKTWLRDNQYVIPAKVDPLLDPYVSGGYKFVALKLTNKATAGDIQPIVMKYKSTKPGIPIRLTGVAATENMDVFVWTLGKERSVPDNYRHATINEARIDWLRGGSNYRSVVTAAMNEAAGQAFVTDYAGDSSAVNLAGISAPNVDVAALQQISDPIAFATAIAQTNLLRGDSYTGFLARYVAKPKALAAKSDSEFYGQLDMYEAELKAEHIMADGAKAADELVERYVTPAKEVRALIEKFPYLTAMYTTMSPDEMTTDPMFVFNPDLPKVSSRHQATGIRKCTSSLYRDDAPIEITLASGLKYTISPNNGGDTPGAAPVKMPAAARVEQLKNVGGASIIKPKFLTTNCWR